MIVDDAPEVVSEISGLLWRRYSILAARDGDEALAILRNSALPDLILLDVMMPGTDGYEVCRRIKADLKLAAVPVIFLTSHSDPEKEAFGLKLGAADYIAKPVAPAILLARVDGQIRLATAVRLLRERNEQMHAEVSLKAMEITAKTQILMTASHDLRQPVHALGLMMEEISRAPEVSSLSCKIARVSMLVQSLSNSLSVLLNAARLDAGLVQTELSEFDMRPLLKKIAFEYEHAAALKKIKIHVIAEPLSVRADESLVRGILQNLLSNAVRYSDAGSIELRADMQKSLVRVSVADTGRGIAAERLTNIFNEDKYVDQIDRARGGIGLGLSIVKRYADLLGSELSINSTVGKGTCVSFDLPFVSGLTSKPPSVNHHQHDTGTLPTAVHIDLFEDDQAVRDATAKALQGWGFSVRAHLNVTDWIAHESAKPATGQRLVIADYHLQSTLDGIDVIAEVRRRAGRPDMPGLLLTGDVDTSLETRASLAHILLRHKPLRPAELHSVVRLLASTS